MAVKKTETKEVKKTTSRTKKPTKVVETVDEVIKDEEEIVVEKKVEVAKRKTFRELRSEFRSKKNDIEVEILNLNSCTTVCIDRDGRDLFRLEKAGDREFITLADLYDVANKFRGNFTKHKIAIIDVDSDEYDIEDILTYLNLEEIYKENEIDNYDTDYIAQIIKLNNSKFEDIVENADISLVRVIASRAIELYRQGKFDSRSKEQILARKLGKEELFDVE